MNPHVKLLFVLLSLILVFLQPVLGLPYGKLDWTAYSQPYLPSPKAPKIGGVCFYTVHPGDTLLAIARRFGVPLFRIAQANFIRNVNLIFIGQTLVIPNCRIVPLPVPKPVPKVPPPACIRYTVRTGDTLLALAARFGTTVRAIALQNRILNPSRIFIGQPLTICPGFVAPPPRRKVILYVVKPGDTLTAIALRFGTTPSAIAAANRLRNIHLIFVGQVLRIP